jgi:hypothetical protein
MNRRDESLFRDLIYFDAPKAASIFSQLRGGLPTETQRTLETLAEASSSFDVNAQVVRDTSGTRTSDRTTELETLVLHHDLLLRVESALFDLEVAADVNSLIADVDAPTVEAVRERVSNFSYLRVEGRTAFEDYERLKKIADNFNTLIEFVSRSAAGVAVAQDPRLSDLETRLSKARVEAHFSEGKKKTEAFTRVVALQAEIREILLAFAGFEAIPDWLIEAISNWIDTFMPSRLNLRVFPHMQLPGLQISANLKRESFVDTDLDTLWLAYGSRPDVRLTLLGLVTSMPSRVPDEFEPLDGLVEVVAKAAANDPAGDSTGRSGAPGAEQRSDETREDQEAFERGFRGVFSGLKGMEEMVRFAGYPTITVQPIAVYRTIRLPETVSAEPATPQLSRKQRAWDALRGKSRDIG